VNSFVPQKETGRVGAVGDFLARSDSESIAPTLPVSEQAKSKAKSKARRKEKAPQGANLAGLF
jgi:hypothetical protein